MAASPTPRPAGAYDARASAPGRVEFIGNHTDYNGGWVLGATIDRRVDVRVARRADQRVGLRSASDVPPVRLSLSRIEAQKGGHAWANYVLGVLVALREEGVPINTGVDVHVQSTLPMGAGLGSSAALELAAAFALTDAFGGSIDRMRLARLAQRAENEFVGVPCGVLDPAVVAFGDKGRLVRLDARTGDVTTVPFPDSTALWIFRTPQAHALADAPYQERHDEARAVRARLNDLLDGGLDHLADVSPDQLERVKEHLPDVLYRRARHVSTEHRRVRATARLLEEGQYEAAGNVLFASHESSRTDYENSTDQLDFVVDRLSDTDHVLGARLTGAGFGGAAMAWTRSAFGVAEARAVAEAYARRFGTDLDVMAGRPARGAYVQS